VLVFIVYVSVLAEQFAATLIPTLPCRSWCWGQFGVLAACWVFRSTPDDGWGMVAGDGLLVDDAIGCRRKNVERNHGTGTHRSRWKRPRKSNGPDHRWLDRQSLWFVLRFFSCDGVFPAPRRGESSKQFSITIISP